MNQSNIQVLEHLLRDGHGRDLVIRVKLTLRSCQVLAFGQAVDLASIGNTPFDVLHFAVSGSPDDYLPVFTSLEYIGVALENHPEWGAHSMLEVSGAELLASAASSSMIVINPWTELEFHLARD